MDLDQLYREYFTSVYRYIFSMCKDSLLAEEITQETFFRALKNLDSFRGESGARVWLCQIAKNIYFTYVNKNNRLCELKCDESDNLVGDSVESVILDREQSAELRAAIHALNEPYKEVFMLRVYADLSFSDIGSLFGKSAGWARVTYHRSRFYSNRSCRCLGLLR